MKPEMSVADRQKEATRLRIEEYGPSRHGEVCRLLAASFRGKFGRVNAENDERTARLLAAAWPYRRESNKLQLAACRSEEPDSGPVGTILLKWRLAGSRLRAEHAGDEEPSLLALMIRFGPLPALRLIVGMAALHYTPAAGECYVEHLAVRSDCRGQGIGRKLMLHSERYAGQAGFRICALHVSKNNAAAVALYQSLGFVKVREERRFASGRLFNEYDWLLMRKEIP
ncbi:hypothetical protein B9G55_15185 [Saccharibacillus sp. O16]|nr:hypothetical protein B9G55_15185 [Saccharibacillus sp. O16]